MAAEQTSVSKAEKHGDKLQSHTIQFACLLYLSTEPLSPFCIAASNLSFTILFSFVSASCSNTKAPAKSEPTGK